MTSELILCSGRLPSREGLYDIAIKNGRIDRIAPAGEQQDAAPVLDLAGRLLLPALVEGHIHLDKTFLGLPWKPHRPGDTIAARIAAERAEREGLGVPLAERARLLVERISAFGTVALRGHVDVDESIGLTYLETLLGLAEALSDRMTMQFVAFPQSGISPRVAELLDEALQLGAAVIGGLDPAGIDGNIEGHLGTVFRLAEKHGARIDIHLHDGGTLGTFELRQIAARSKALGLGGRVAVSHAFALGIVDDREFDQTARALADGGVAIMTNGPGADAIPPVKRLIEAGVIVFGGSDNIRDAWSPYGNGDLLERAAMIGYRADFRADADVERAFELVTAAPRQVLGLEPVTLAVGSPADLIALPASGIAEAVVGHDRDRIVIKAGRVLSTHTAA